MPFPKEDRQSHVFTKGHFLQQHKTKFSLSKVSKAGYPTEIKCSAGQIRRDENKMELIK